MSVKRRSISNGRENTYKQRRDTDWQIPATEYTLVNHGPVLAAERRMTRSSSWNSLKFLSGVTRRSCCAASLSHHRRVLRARKLAPPPKESLRRSINAPSAGDSLLFCTWKIRRYILHLRNRRNIILWKCFLRIYIFYVNKYSFFLLNSEFLYILDNFLHSKYIKNFFIL